MICTSPLYALGKGLDIPRESEVYNEGLLRRVL